MKLKSIFTFILLSFVKSFNFDNKKYCNKFKIPLLNKNQELLLEFDNNKCKLYCKGYINFEKKDWWYFNTDNIDDINKKVLEDREIINLTRKFLFSLRDIRYNTELDTISINIKSYIFPIDKKISLYPIC
tara:strand:+ start:4198 stop:4587 length:390 start_codon:yes stop_codon:yes gene_type:complete